MDELARLQAALLDKDMEMLELQQEHVSVLSALRQEIALQQETIASLNREASSTPDSLYECKRLQAQLELCQAKLTASEERYTELFRTAGEGRLQSAVSQLRLQLAEANAALESAQADAAQSGETVRAQEAELESVRAHIYKQQASLRELSDKIQELVSKAAASDSDNVQLRAQLERRNDQIQKAATMLRKLRDREEAVAASVTLLNEKLSQATADAERYKSAAGVLQGQQQVLNDHVESLKDRARELEEARRIDAEAVSSSQSNAQQATNLSLTYDSLRRERDALSSALENARVEARRETIALQRLADERQRLIVSLQADLNAATNAIKQLASPSPCAPASPNPSSSDSVGSSSSQISGTVKPPQSASADLNATTQGASAFISNNRTFSASSPATARSRRSAQMIGISDRSPAANEATPAARDSPGSVVELVQLRLQCESLSHKLRAQSERVAELERDQDDLLAVNDRLRRMLRNHSNEHGPSSSADNGDGVGSGSGSGSAASTPRRPSRTAPALPSAPAITTTAAASAESSAMPSSSTATPAVITALAEDVQRSEAVFGDVRTLLLALNRLFTYLRSRVEGQDADSIPFRTIYLPGVEAKQRFGSVAAALQTSFAGQRVWTDTASLQADLRLATTHAEALRNDLADVAAAEIGQACHMQ